MKELPLIIITGGTSGIGLALAKRLIMNYRLALVYRSNHQRASESLESIKKISSNDCKIYAQNIFDDDSASAVYSVIKKDFQTIPHVLINAAGDTKMGLFLRSSHQDLIEMFNSHVLGVMAITRLAAEDMYTNRFGRIINFSSVASFGNRKGLSAYCAAKSAIEGFTRAIAQELFHRNITVNCIQPGLVNIEGADLSHYKNFNLVPPEQIADQIELLIDLKSSHVTGALFLIDGGSGRWIGN